MLAYIPWPIRYMCDLILWLVQAVEPCENDKEPIKRMKNAAKRDLNKRYSQMPDAILISSFLHPRTKQLNFISNEQREQVHETVTSELLDYVTGQSNGSETLQSLISSTDQTSATVQLTMQTILWTGLTTLLNQKTRTRHQRAFETRSHENYNDTLLNRPQELTVWSGGKQWNQYSHTLQC